MFKYVLSVIVAGLLAVMVSPMALADTPEDETMSAAPVAVHRVNIPSMTVSDEATMVLVGSVMIGLAAVVRRAA